MRTNGKEWKDKPFWLQNVIVSGELIHQEQICISRDANNDRFDVYVTRAEETLKGKEAVRKAIDLHKNGELWGSGYSPGGAFGYKCRCPWCEPDRMRSRPLRRRTGQNLRTLAKSGDPEEISDNWDYFTLD